MIKNDTIRLIGVLFTTVLIILTLRPAFGHGNKDKSLISPAELASNIESFHILDIRSKEDFSIGHVPRAGSLPLVELSLQNLQKMGVDNSKTIVIYGSSEKSAQKGKLLLEVLGLTNTRILAGGFTHYEEDRQPIQKGEPEQHHYSSSESQRISTLTVNPKDYDFGIITGANGIVTTTFKVANNGNRKVQITEITTSCGCTSAKIANTVIGPGKSSLLTVFFDPNFHKEPEGKFSRTVFLQTSEGFEIQAKINVEIVGQEL